MQLAELLRFVLSNERAGTSGRKRRGLRVSMVLCCLRLHLPSFQGALPQESFRDGQKKKYSTSITPDMLYTLLACAVGLMWGALGGGQCERAASYSKQTVKDAL